MNRTIEARVASLETLVTAGKVVETSAALAALNARTTATENANKEQRASLEAQQRRADDVLTKRFDAANEVRGAMNDASRVFVTRGEFYAAFAGVILMLIGLVITLLIALARVGH